MDVLSFTERLAHGEPNEVIERWATDVREQLAERTLRLARWADQIPEELQSEYVALVGRVLATLPEEPPLLVSRALMERLRSLLPPASQKQLEAKVRSVNGAC